LRALARQEALLMALDGDDLIVAQGALEGALSRGESARALAPLAEAQRLRGEADEAIRTAERGIAAFPDHVGMRIVLARALADAGRGDEADRAYRDVLERDPENLEARAHLAPTEPRVPGAGDLAGRTTGEPVGEPPTDGLSEGLSDLAGLFSARRPLEEHPDRDDPLSGIATLTLAEIYARQGLFARAVEVCERILERSPDDERAQSKLEEYRRELATAE
jgi:tetratricopeptide (TPR) repeat protein